MKGKRLLAMLLAVMMIVTALPIGIFAEEEQAELPGAGFFSAPEYTAEYYVGTDLPFTGQNKDAHGGAYEVYYYLKRSDDLVENVTVLNFDGETDPFVTVELVDGQYAKLTLKEGFEPDMGFDIMMINSLGGEWGQSFSIVDQREAGGNSDSTIPIGYYGSESGAAHTSLGKGEGVIAGEVGETVTAYLVWSPDECGELQDVLVSFRPSATGMLFEEKEMSEAADTLENYGVTLLLNEEDGYIQVQATIGESLNVGLIPVFAGAAQEEYWLSIDPEKGSSDEEEDQPSFTKGPGLYWYNFDGMKNGKPVYDYSDVDTAMWDEPGQDIEAVFVLWDGETAVEIAPDQLTFPKELKWKFSEDYANAVYMEFDTVMDAVISYNGYEFQLVVALPDVGFYSAPERTVENLVTTGLTYTGKDKDENDKNCTVYYILSDGEETFTDIEVMMGDAEANANEVRVVLSDDGKSGLLYLYEELQFGESYMVSLYQNGTRMWRRGFSVRDQQPGLYYCSRGDVQDVLEGNIESLRSNLQMEINSTYARALFFVDGDKVILLDDKADLNFDKYGEAEWDAEENCFMICMTKLGNYEITYTHSDGVEYTLPVTVTLPAFGLYSETSASKETYLGDEILFAGDPTVVYLVCREQGSKITGLNPDARDEGSDMRFLTYSIDPQGQYIKLEIGENVLSDKEYAMEVYFMDEDNRKQDDRVFFTVVKRDPALLWFPVEEDEDGGYEVITSDNGRSKLSCQPGDSVLLQIRWFDGAQHTVLDLADVEVPAFMTAERVSDGVLRLTCNGLGIGEITSDLCPGWTIDVTAQTADALDFYTRPERKSAYADSDFNGDDGDVITRYLMWDQTLLPDVDKVTVTLNDGEGNGNVLVDADVTTTDLSRYDIQLTSDLQNGWVKVDAQIAGWRNVTFKAWKNGVVAASINVNIDEDYDRWKENGMVLDYDIGNGIVPLTINMGRIRNGYVNLGGWNSLGGLKDELEHDLILGALAFEGEQNESDAPASFYEAISDVRFEVSKWVNEDGSGDQTESNIWFSPVTTTTYNGMKLYGVQILSAPGGFGHIQVAITFTLTVGGKETTYTFYESFAYNLAADFTIELEELDTADKLNAVLGTPDGLENWMEENEPATIAAMRRLKAQGEIVELEVVLPPVEYTDIIDYRVVTEFSRLTLCGSEDKKGNRTTLPGLRSENNSSFFMADLNFVADPQITQSYNGEKFTCGVLMYGSKKSDIYKVMDCTFEGFDYGVRTTTAGYTCCWDCQFVNCEIAYLLDCEGKEKGNSNADMLNCLFVNCGTGVRIKHLPEYITPYGYRIYNCDFIGNDMDIDVSQRGRFYFYQNYYGDPKHKNDPVEDATDVHKRPPRVRGRGYADVVVNPRWRDPVTLDGSNHSSNHLIVDTKHGLANYMFNDDALGWSFDSSILNTDLSNQDEGVSLAMTDDEEETIGTWNLEGGAAQTQLLSLLADEPVVDTFCPALDIREKADGSIKVTVDDSDLFTQRKVTLTIPCEFVLAAVTWNDDAVEAFTANGQVTFTVTAGGTYVISEALTEEVMEQSFVTGGAPETDEGETVPKAEVAIGWFDFNAQDDTEDTSFVQIGTATQQIVQQVNPDAENLGTAEDTIVETEVITVQAVYQAPVVDDPEKEIQITVLLVLYDSDGRMIAMKEQAAQQNEGTKVITVECDASLIDTDAVTVKAFVISADGKMSPLAPVPFSQTLEIPAK